MAGSPSVAAESTDRGTAPTGLSVGWPIPARETTPVQGVCRVRRCAMAGSPSVTAEGSNRGTSPAGWPVGGPVPACKPSRVSG